MTPDEIIEALSGDPVPEVDTVTSTGPVPYEGSGAIDKVLDRGILGE